MLHFNSEPHHILYRHKVDKRLVDWCQYRFPLLVLKTLYDWSLLGPGCLFLRRFWLGGLRSRCNSFSHRTLDKAILLNNFLCNRRETFCFFDCLLLDKGCWSRGHITRELILGLSLVAFLAHLFKWIIKRFRATRFANLCTKRRGNWAPGFSCTS